MQKPQNNEIYTHSITRSFSGKHNTPLIFLSLFVSCRLRFADAVAVVHCGHFGHGGFFLSPLKYKEWLYSFSCGGGTSAQVFFFFWLFEANISRANAPGMLSICALFQKKKKKHSGFLNYKNKKCSRFHWKHAPAIRYVTLRQQKKNAILLATVKEATTKYLCPCFPILLLFLLLLLPSTFASVTETNTTHPHGHTNAATM